MKKLLTALILLLAVCSARGATYHVNTSGALLTALTQSTTPASPGDVIIIDAGYYNTTNSHGFTCDLQGTSTDPYYVKAAAGAYIQMVDVDSWNEGVSPTTAQYVWFINLDISDAASFHLSQENGGTDPGAVGTCSHIKYISCTFHDCVGAGAGAWHDCTDLEFNGCLFISNGRGEGYEDDVHNYGVYNDNNPSTGNLTHLFKHCVFAHNWNYNFQGWAQTPQVDYTIIDGCTFYDAGWIYNQDNITTSPFSSYNSNVIMGANTNCLDHDQIINSNFWYTLPNQRNGTCGIYIGVVAPATNFTFQNNYVVDGGLTISQSSGTFSGNTYIANFPGSDQPGASQVLSSRPTSGTYISTQIVDYSTQRGYGEGIVTIYNWGNAGSVNVDVSGFLSPGGPYTVMDANNLSRGTWTSGTVPGNGIISIPMNNTTVDVPILGTGPQAQNDAGQNYNRTVSQAFDVTSTYTSADHPGGVTCNYRRPQLTQPTFGVFVVTGTASSGGGIIYGGNHTYFVDPVNGSDANTGYYESDHAWKTIAKVNGFSFATGDSVLLVCGGTWNEELVIPHDGMYFGNYGTGVKPMLTYTGTYGVAFNGKNNVTVNGIDESGAQRAFDFEATVGSYVFTVENCKVYGVANTLRGFDCGLYNNLQITNGLFDHDTVQNDVNDEAFWLGNGTEVCQYCVGINNCVDFRVGIRGVNCNYLHCQSITPVCECLNIEYEAGYPIPTGTIVSDCWLVGGATGMPAVENRGRNSTFTYNVVYGHNNGSNGNAVRQYAPFENAVWENNTIIAQGTGYVLWFDSVDSTTFKNNIVVGIGNLELLSSDNATSNSTWVSDYNDWFSTGGFQFGGTHCSTLSAFTGLVGGDSHSITGDPTFVTNYTNLALQGGSPCINTGTSVGLTSDYLGNAIVGNPDMGAFEYQAGLGTPVASTATGITSGGFVANWGTTTGASNYLLDVATDNGFTSFVSGFSRLNVGNVTSTSVNGLSSATQYFYRVAAQNGSQTSANSNTISLTTLSTGGNPPSTPAIGSASAIGPSSFYANWTQTATATGYYLEVSTSPTFSPFVVGYGPQNIPSGSTTTSLVSPLQASTPYYWRVAAYNAYGTSSYSSYITTTTSALSSFPQGSFSLLPINLSAAGTVTLTWTATGATSATIDNGVGSVATSGGSKSVSVSQTTTFTLTLTNSAGSKTYTTTATVTPAMAQLYRKAVFLHHSVGDVIFHGSYDGTPQTTTVPLEVAKYNTAHSFSGANAVSMSEPSDNGACSECWPNSAAHAQSENDWWMWQQIFAGQDDNSPTLASFLVSYPVVIVKTCYLSEEFMASDDSVAAYKAHYRAIVKSMASHPANFFILWTNYPAYYTGAQNQSRSATFVRWAKDTLFAGKDSYGTFPKNVYIFDPFRKIADAQTGSLPAEYIIGNGDEHPSNAAVAIVTPAFVKETFDAALAYETGGTPPPPPATGTFSIGDTVSVAAAAQDCLNARSAPSLSSSVNECEPVGNVGIVLAGPTTADGYDFYQIAYADGIVGWSAGKLLQKGGTIALPAPPTGTLTVARSTLPYGGGLDTVSWTSSGATSGTLNGSPIASGSLAKGSQSMQISTTATITLVLTNSGGSTTKTALVTVSAQPPPVLPCNVDSLIAVGWGRAAAKFDSVFKAGQNSVVIVPLIDSTQVWIHVNGVNTKRTLR